MKKYIRERMRKRYWNDDAFDFVGKEDWKEIPTFVNQIHNDFLLLYIDSDFLLLYIDNDCNRLNKKMKEKGRRIKLKVIKNGFLKLKFPDFNIWRHITTFWQLVARQLSEIFFPSQSFNFSLNLPIFTPSRSLSLSLPPIYSLLNSSSQTFITDLMIFLLVSNYVNEYYFYIYLFFYSIYLNYCDGRKMNERHEREREERHDR